MLISSDLPLNKIRNESLLREMGCTHSLFSGRNPHDSIGVNLEGNLNLRNTTRSGRDAGEFEFAENVLGRRTFTFVDLDEDGSLNIGGGQEDLTLLVGGDGVTRDELGEDSNGGFDTERVVRVK